MPSFAIPLLDFLKGNDKCLLSGVKDFSYIIFKDNKCEKVNEVRYLSNYFVFHLGMGSGIKTESGKQPHGLRCD